MTIRTELETFSTFDMNSIDSVGAWRMFMKEVYFKLDIVPRQDDILAGRLTKRNISSLGTSFLSANDQRVIRSKELTVVDVAECFCLVFVTRGSFAYRQAGREAFAEAGDVYLLNAQEAYEVDLTNSPEMLCLTLPADVLRSRVKNVDDLCAREQFADRTMAFALRSLVSGALADEPIPDPMRLQELCLNMADMMLAPGSGRERDRLAYSHRNAPFVVSKAKLAMLARLSDPDLSVGEIAHVCCVSTRQLQHALQSVGTTFVGELTKIRLTTAASMLRERGQKPKRIGDVALQCGFANQAYFSTCFKKFFGHAPRDEFGS